MFLSHFRLRNVKLCADISDRNKQKNIYFLRIIILA